MNTYKADQISSTGDGMHLLKNVLYTLVTDLWIMKLNIWDTKSSVSSPNIMALTLQNYLIC